MKDDRYRTGQKNERGQVICGSKKNGKDETPCQSPFVNQRNGRCKKHGADSPYGIAHYKFKDGSRSKYMVPARMRETFAKAMDDPDLLALTQEIALTDARIADLVDRVDSGESGANYDKAVNTYSKLVTAVTVGDTDAVATSLTELGDALKAGQADYKVWNEIQSAIHARRGLVETERKRLMDMEQLVQVGDMLALADKLLLAVREHVTDVSTLQRIQTAFDTSLSVTPKSRTH